MFWDKEAETMNTHDINSLAEKRLRKVVKDCHKTSIFYKKRFDESDINPNSFRGLKDLVKIPFTTKSDLRNNYPLGLLAVQKSDVIRYHASSGTTGKPTVVAYTKKDIETWAELMARVLTATGVSNLDTIQLIYNYAFFTGGLGFHYGAEKIGAAVIPSGVGNSKKQLLTMRDLNVTAISSTPSYALYLAEYARGNGIDVWDFGLKTGVWS